jgi:hypothetical protein
MAPVAAFGYTLLEIVPLSGWMLEDAMWRPNEPVEEDVSDLPSIDPHGKRPRSRRRAWRDGLPTKLLLGMLNVFGPTERSSVP